MTRTQSFHRRRSVRALVCLMVVAFAATSCDGGAAKVATVNGETIRNAHFAHGVALFAKVSGSTSVPAANGVSPVSDAAQYALFLIQTHAIKTLNAKHHSVVGDSELAAMRKELLASQSGAALRSAPGWFVDSLVDAQTNYQTLIHYYGARVDQSARIKAYYQANVDQFRQVCMDVIAGNDEEQLKAAKQQIVGGIDFATVAKAVAAEQPAGADGKKQPALGEKADGDVGCIPVANLSSLFASPTQVSLLTKAAKGSFVGPIGIAGGSFMLFRVRSVSVQTLAEATPAITQALGPAGQSEAQQALNAYLIKADIDLNPRLGTWKTGIGYTPPQGAKGGSTSTTTPLVGG